MENWSGDQWQGKQGKHKSKVRGRTLGIHDWVIIPLPASLLLRMIMMQVLQNSKGRQERSSVNEIQGRRLKSEETYSKNPL